MGLTAAKLAGSDPTRGRMKNDYYATPPHCYRADIERNQII